MNCYKIDIKKVLGKPTVKFTIGVQTFSLAEVEDKESAEHYKRMLNNALYNLYQAAYQDGVNDNKQGRAN